MKEKKVDRRVKYTKMVIKESFIKILKKKPISKITVKEICDDADINRATFYSHYLDHYDLLQQIENEVITDINQYLSEYKQIENPLASKDNVIEMTEKVLEYIEENRELFNILLNSHGDTNFQQEIIKIIQEQHNTLMNENTDLSKENAEYVFHFLASGAFGLIQLWLKDGTKIQPSKMAELILKMAANGLSSFEKSPSIII